MALALAADVAPRSENVDDRAQVGGHGGRGGICIAGNDRIDDGGVLFERFS